MNKTYVWFTILIVALSLTLSGCSQESTPAPTYTAFPTYTPFPTLVAAPTYTFPPPAPTNTSPPPTPTRGTGAQCSGTPVISSFTANPATIQVGQKSTLQYGLVSNAQAAVLVSPEGRLGVATPGQTTVQPDQTTTYSLFAACGNTIVQQQVTVNVEVPSGCSGVPVVEAFTANPSTIAPGQTTTLQWSAVENASAAVLVAPDGKRGVATPGELVVEPNQTTTYAVVAFCEDDVIQRNVTVTVEGTTTCGGAPVISSFTAEPTTVQSGQSTTLQWGLVSNASGAYLTDGANVTGIGTPGQLEVTPEQTTTYSLVAFCGGDIALSDLTVTVQ